MKVAGNCSRVHVGSAMHWKTGAWGHNGLHCIIYQNDIYRKTAGSDAYRIYSV
jgi:hypothetical protein